MTLSYHNISFSAIIGQKKHKKPVPFPGDQSGKGTVYWCELLIVHFIHMLDQHKDFIAVTPFIIIPGNQFNKFIC